MVLWPFAVVVVAVVAVVVDDAAVVGAAVVVVAVVPAVVDAAVVAVVAVVVVVDAVVVVVVDAVVVVVVDAVEEVDTVVVVVVSHWSLPWHSLHTARRQLGLSSLRLISPWSTHSHRLSWLCSGTNTPVFGSTVHSDAPQNGLVEHSAQKAPAHWSLRDDVKLSPDSPHSHTPRAPPASRLPAPSTEHVSDAGGGSSTVPSTTCTRPLSVSTLAATTLARTLGLL